MEFGPNQKNTDVDNEEIQYQHEQSQMTDVFELAVNDVDCRLRYCSYWTSSFSRGYRLGLRDKFPSHFSPLGSVVPHYLDSCFARKSSGAVLSVTRLTLFTHFPPSAMNPIWPSI